MWLGLALHVLASSEQSTPAVLGITSAIHGEGKTTNCLGLSSTLARETDARVALVECDVANPSLASQLDLEPRPGLVEYVIGGGSIEDFIRRTNVPNLDVIVAGGEEDDDIRLESPNQLALSKMRRNLSEILTSLKERYGHTLLDLPPVLTNPYARDMINSTDGTFLTVRAGVTPIDSMKRAVEEIGQGRLSGVILAGAGSGLPTWLADLLSESE